MTTRDQFAVEVAADEAGAAGDQDHAARYKDRAGTHKSGPFILLGQVYDG
jgi:hypothetical protein